MKLVVSKSGITQDIFVIDQSLDLRQEFYVGRSDECHIKLNDSSLSREHAVFILTKERLEFVLLADTKDMTKTSSLKLLSDGEVVSIGSYQIRVTEYENEESKSANHSIEKKENPPTPIIDETVIVNKDTLTEKKESIGPSVVEFNVDDVNNLEVSIDVHGKKVAGFNEMPETFKTSGSEIEFDFDDNTGKNQDIEINFEAPVNGEIEIQQNSPEVFSNDDQLNNGYNSNFDNNYNNNGNDKILENSNIDQNRNSLDNQFQNEEVRFENPDLSYPEENADSNVNSTENSSFQMEVGNEELPSSGDATGPDDNDKTKILQDFIRYYFVISGNGAPYDKYLVEKKSIVIGRKSDCDIVIDDKEVSSRHAKILLNHNNLTIEDLDSVNGVFVNGAKVNKHVLVAGDNFVIGDVRFQLLVQSDFIDSEKSSIMPVQVDEDTGEIDLNSIQKELRDQQNIDLKNSSNDSKNSKKSGKLGNKFSGINISFLKRDPKRAAIYGAVVVMLIFILFVDNSDDGGGDNSAGVNGNENKEKSKDKNTLENNNSSSNANNGTGENSDVATGTTDANGNVLDKDKKIRVFTPEELQYLQSHYALAMSFLEKGDYVSALNEIDLIRSLDEGYKDVQSLWGLAKDGLAKLEEQERKRKELEEKIIRDKEILAIIEKLEVSIKDKNLSTADNYVAQIVEKDPENVAVTNYKIEIETIREEQKRILEEEERKKELRAQMLGFLLPGKTFFAQQDWYKAMIKLQDFLAKKSMDEDLVIEASTMLAQAKEKLLEQISPILESARMAKQAQDSKKAYEFYLEILRIDPSHEEANIESRDIKDRLMAKSMKIYREALVSESLSLFSKAKEKYQEVLINAPSDSEYFKKAESKLKQIYLDSNDQGVLR